MLPPEPPLPAFPPVAPPPAVPALPPALVLPSFVPLPDAPALLSVADPAAPPAPPVPEPDDPPAPVLSSPPHAPLKKAGVMIELARKRETLTALPIVIHPLGARPTPMWMVADFLDPENRNARGPRWAR
jgi:hypothetical protein